MSARDLVGRPLVPFFDADENVNETLQVDPATRAHETLDVDARVWDRELGYFVYPTDASTASASSSHAHSQPIAIQRATPQQDTASNGASNSYGKLLLTPDMLSRSAPTTSAIPHNEDSTAQAPPSTNSHATAAGRSSSTKRASRQKSRSSTPSRSRNKRESPQATSSSNSQATTSTSDSGGEGSASGSNSDQKSKGSRKKAAGATPKKSRNKQQKAKEDLSANGKWAWSAFQSSPDPKSLPLPPFAAGGGGASPGLGALPPPLDPPKIEERLDPPMPAQRLDFSTASPSLEAPQSIEHSMTQDLRRMLNIGS